MTELAKLHSYDVDHTGYPGPSTLHTLGEFAAAGAFVGDPEATALIEELLTIRAEAEAADGNMLPYIRQADKLYPLLVGRVDPDVRNRGAEATAEYIEQSMYPVARDSIEERRDRGDKVVLISNGPDITIHALGRRLGVPAIGRKPEEYALGSRHSSMDKWLRLSTFCANELGLYLEADPAAGIEQNAVLAEHWGDSPADLPLLLRARTPVVVNPNMGLEDIATEKGWQIIDVGEIPFYGDLSHTFQPRTAQEE